MTDESRYLVVNIVPKLDTEAFNKALTDAVKSLNISLDLGVKPSEEAKAQVQDLSGKQDTDAKDDADAKKTGIAGNAGNTNKKETAQKESDDSADGSITQKFGAGLRVLKRDTSGITDGETRANANAMKEISSGLNTIFKTGISVIKQAIGVVQDIYKELSEASPLLRAIESLFNLAMQLFFMPLGNKLAEILIPATLDLVDKVTGLWDMFEGKSLGDMLNFAIAEGVKLFGSYFNTIGDALSEQTGFAATIGSLLKTLGSFIENDLASFLSLLLNVTSFILTHIKEIVSACVGFFAASLALQVATMYTIAASNSVGGWFGGGFIAATGGVLSAAAIGVGAGSETYRIMNGDVKYAASGGYVPATAGGQLVVAGEGGEGEYIVPESKAASMGTTNINYYINGYTDSELKSIIRDTVNEQVSNNRLRSGF